MPYKFNPFTRKFDYYISGGSIEQKTSDYSAVAGNVGKIWMRTDLGKPTLKTVVSHLNGLDEHTSLLLHMEDEGLTDSSANSHTVSLEGNVARSATQKKFGSYSAVFDGTGDWLAIPAHAALNALYEDFAIELQVYRAEIGVDHRLLSYCGTSDDYSFEFWISSDNHLCFLWCTTDAGEAWDNTDDYEGTTVIPKDAWKHLAVARMGGHILAFIDGALEKIWSIGSSAIRASTSDLWIGSSHYGPNTFNMNGYIDEVRFSKGTSRIIKGATLAGSTFPQKAVPYSADASYSVIEIQSIP